MKMKKKLYKCKKKILVLNMKEMNYLCQLKKIND